MYKRDQEKNIKNLSTSRDGATSARGSSYFTENLTAAE